MRANFYDSLVNLFRENDWIIGPKATHTYDRSQIIEFDKVEQLRQENCIGNPDEFSRYAAQYLNTMEEHGWWVKVCPPDTDESDDEGEEPFTDLQDIIEYVVDVHLHGYASDEPEVIDLTGDDSDSDDDSDDDNDNETEFDPWDASFWDPGPPVRNLLEEFQEQA